MLFFIDSCRDDDSPEGEPTATVYSRGFLEALTILNQKSPQSFEQGTRHLEYLDGYILSYVRRCDIIFGQFINQNIVAKLPTIFKMHRLTDRLPIPTEMSNSETTSGFKAEFWHRTMTP